MKQRILTGLALFFIIAVMFLTKIIIETTIIFDVFIGLIAIVGAIEMANLLQKMGRFNYNFLIIAFPIFAYALIMLGINFQWSVLVVILGFVGLIVFFTIVSSVITLCTIARTENEMRARKIRLSKFSFSIIKGLNAIIGYIYPTLLLLILVPINHLGELTYLFSTTITDFNLASIVILAICFLIPCICDTFAYFTGSLIGGKKLAPTISPKKTISGAIGGIVWTTLLVTVLFLIFSSIPTFAELFFELGISWVHIAVLSFLSSLVCESGDLFESYLKRRADVKDSGDILPGHGGILDRIDGFTFTNVIVFVCLFVIL